MWSGLSLAARKFMILASIHTRVFEIASSFAVSIRLDFAEPEDMSNPSLLVGKPAARHSRISITSSLVVVVDIRGQLIFSGKVPECGY
jgi:hypothetical protein